MLAAGWVTGGWVGWVIGWLGGLGRVIGWLGGLGWVRFIGWLVGCDFLLMAAWYHRHECGEEMPQGLMWVVKSSEIHYDQVLRVRALAHVNT